MSNLESYGSTDEKKQQTDPNSSEPAASNDPNDQLYADADKLIISQNQPDQIAAMKLIFNMISKGLNVSRYFAFVAQQVASNDPTSRNLAYIYLNHYAGEDPETALLSLNTFQRSLSNSDPLERASAIRAMSSIRSKEILPAVLSAIKQIINDPSPYVKKAAAISMIKVSEMEPQEITHYMPLIAFLLGDSSPIAFSGAIAAYWALSPDNISLLHPHFKSICQNINKLDAYAQVLTLRSLMIYARYCFKNPQADKVDNEDDSNFWDETGVNEYSSDLLLLVNAALRLLSSLNSAVVLAAVSVIYYIAPPTYISSIARPLIRLLYDDCLTEEIILKVIITIASTHYYIFVPHVIHFFVRDADSLIIKQLKLKVLSLLTTSSNAAIVFTELSKYAHNSDQDFAAAAVETLGKASIRNPDIIPQCLGYLLRLLNQAEEKVLNKLVLTISQILRQKRGTDDESQALKYLCKKFLLIKEPNARTAVLSIVGDMYETHPEYARELLRYIALYYLNEQSRVRLQSMTLAAKLIASGDDSKIPLYILQVGERDAEYDIRDRAQFYLSIINNQSEEVIERLKIILFPPKPVSKLYTDNCDDYDSEYNKFTLGTLSHYFNKSMDGYEALPDWAPEDELPDESVRSQVQLSPNGTKMSAINDSEDFMTSFFSEKLPNNQNPMQLYSDDYSYYSYSYSDSNDENLEENNNMGFFD